MPEFAFATLVTSDAYAKGAQVVAAALRELHPRPPTPPEVEFETVCIVTPETVNVDTIKALRKAFDVVIGVEVIDEHQTAGLALLGRPDLSSVLTKIHVFRLTQFSKVIFLDADVLPVRPLSHLFNLPHEFSAVPDVGWPDIFNSGMMVLTPGEDKFQQIRELVKVRGSWDGGDQGILNEWRGEDWHRLSFTYNTTPTAAYTYAPAYERFGSKISVIHFIGPNKPWKSALWRPPFAHSTPSPTTSHAAPEFEFQTPQFATSTTQPPVTQQSYAYDKLVDRWFDVYDRHVRPPETVASPEAYIPQRYEAAWDHPSAAAPHTFDLEELKRLAMEGSGQGTSFVAPPVSSGQGQYVSLPLDGRVDLMRPRPPTPEPRIDSPPVHQAEAYHAVEHQPYTEVQHHDSASSPSESQAWAPNVPYITHTEASPPEHERRPRSPPLVSWNPAIEPPPTTFVHNPTQKSIGAYFPNVWDLPTTRHDDDDTEFEDLPYDDGGQDEPYPQVRNEDPPQHAPYHQDSYEDESHQWGGPQPESQQQTSRQPASYPPVHYQPTHNQQVSYQQPSYQQTPHQQAPYQQTPHQQTPYQQAPYQQTPYQRTPYQQAPYQQPSYQQPSYQQPPHQSVSNQPTPTQLGPKQSAPHQTTSHQFSSQQPQRPHQSYRSPAPRRRPPSPKPSDFFPVSAPPAIPQSIAHEYLAVTSAAPPTAKATTLFPWESAPRAPPRRVFPAGDAPPPVVAPKVEPIRTVEQAPPAQPSPTRSSPSAPLTSKFDPRTATFEETVLYANKMLSPPAGDGSAPAIARDAARALYSPGERKAGSLVYSNAWDNIPSIGHYVSRLVKPTGSSQPLHSPKKSIFAHVDGRRSPPKNQEQEREEADYGDDEDDAESNDDETGLDTPQAKPRRGKGGEGSPGGANRGQGSGSRSGRSRGASTSGRYSPLGSSQVIVGTGAGADAAPAGRVYRSQGVQTTPKSRRSIGVQVSVLDSSPVPPPAPATVPAPAPAPAPARASVPAPTALGRRSYSVGAGAPPIQTTPPQVQSPSGTRAFSPNSPLSPRVEETASTALRSLASLAPFALPSTPPQAGDRGMLSSPIALNSPISPSTGLRKVPSAQGSPSTTTSTLSPITAPSIASSPIARPSTLRARTSSNATDPTARASWLSTSSSTTAVEPAITTATSPEGLILQPVQRTATRKWDPARGVDVFKRDSQEVLARFLKMAPWAESPHDSTPGSPTI